MQLWYHFGTLNYIYIYIYLFIYLEQTAVLGIALSKFRKVRIDDQTVSRVSVYRAIDINSTNVARVGGKIR